jgi:diguanylate cyclase (GGDEF)-like protein
MQLSPRWPVRWLAAAVLLIAVGVAGSLVAAREVARAEAGDARQRFLASSERVASSLGLATQRGADLVVVGAARLATDPEITNRDVGRWVGLTRVFERHPEINAVGLASYVRDSELEEFRVRMRADPPGPLGPGGSYAITPPGRRSFYCLIRAQVTRPGTPVLPAAADRCADALGVQTLLAARDSGHGAYLGMDSGGVKLLAIQSPVYEGGKVPATVAARRRAFIGWSGVMVSPAALLERALVGQPGTAATLSYRNELSDVSFSQGSAPADGQSRTIAIGDGWAVHIQGAAVASGSLATRDSKVVLIAGILLSGLAGALLLALTTSRSRALRLVAEKTSELNHMALHDALTGLPNRTLVIERAEQMITRAARHRTGVAALFVDLDGFKPINDSFGHAAGDQVLITASERMARIVRGEDTVGRLGGDEFVVLLDTLSPGRSPELVAERLIAALRRPIDIDDAGRTAAVSASIGIAFGQASADELLRDADLALYAAKAAGKDRYVLFEATMQISDAGRRSGSDGSWSRDVRP